MRAVELFGTHLRDTHSFITHLKKDVPINLVELIDKGHTLLSQPMQESWFVRPEKPTKKRAYYAEEYRKWQNWKPLFKGEWSIERAETITDSWDRCLFYRESKTDEWIRAGSPLYDWDEETLNDFAFHCAKAGIPLELNEDYEILSN